MKRLIIGSLSALLIALPLWAETTTTSNSSTNTQSVESTPVISEGVELKPGETQKMEETEVETTTEEVQKQDEFVPTEIDPEAEEAAE